MTLNGRFLCSLLSSDLNLLGRVKLIQRGSYWSCGVDCAGPGEAPKGLKVLKEGGSLVSIATKDPAYRHVVAASSEVLEMLNPYLESGAIKPIIDSKGKFKFSEVVEAFEYLETGRATGKVVIVPIA